MDEQRLLAAVDDYCRALHMTDVELLDEVFHPAASLFDVDDGQVRADPYWHWRQDVDARSDPASAGHERIDEVLQVTWLSEDAATVALRIQIFDQVFVDHLQLVRDGERFRVVAKTWLLNGSSTDGYGTSVRTIVSVS